MPVELGAPPNSRYGRPRVTLFSVPFKSRMTDEDIERLRRSLDLVTYVTDTSGVSGASPGVVPDSWSGLFLERGAGQDEWVLEGRTWDDPPESAVYEWHVRAALAAKELDPTVQMPARRPGPW
jgi:hypothetical protein